MQYNMENISMADKRVAELMASALHYRRQQVRVRALRLWARIADEAAVKALVETLRDNDARICQQAAAMLTKIGRPAILPLIEMLGDANEEICVQAAKTISMIGESAVGPLINALNDENEQVRILAAVALGWIKDKRAVEPLQIILEDRNAEVKEAAIEALTRLTQMSIA